MGKSKRFYVYLHYKNRPDDDSEGFEHGYVRNDQLEGFKDKKIEDISVAMEVTALSNSKRSEKWQGTVVDFDENIPPLLSRADTRHAAMKAKNPEDVMQGKRASIPSKHLQNELFVKDDLDDTDEDKEDEKAANATATRKDILKAKRERRVNKNIKTLESQTELQGKHAKKSSTFKASSTLDTAVSGDDVTRVWEELKIAKETAALKREIENLKSDNNSLHTKVTLLEEEVQSLKGEIKERNSLSSITDTLSSVTSSLSDLCLSIELRKAPVVYSSTSPHNEGTNNTSANETIHSEESEPVTFTVGGALLQHNAFKKPCSDAPKEDHSVFKKDADLLILNFENGSAEMDQGTVNAEPPDTTYDELLNSDGPSDSEADEPSMPHDESLLLQANAHEEQCNENSNSKSPIPSDLNDDAGSPQPENLAQQATLKTPKPSAQKRKPDRNDDAASTPGSSGKKPKNPRIGGPMLERLQIQEMIRKFRDDPESQLLHKRFESDASLEDITKLAKHGVMIEANKLRAFMAAKKMSNEIKAVNLMVNIFKPDALGVCVPGGPTEGSKRRGGKLKFDWVPLYAPAKKAILEAATNSKEDDVGENTDLKQMWQKVSKAMSKKILSDYRVRFMKDELDPQNANDDDEEDATPL